MKKDWTYKKLGEVAEIYQPKTLATSELIADGKYLVYGANGVIGRYNEYNHKEKEILVTCRGATCGTINISEPYSWINGNAMVVHIIDDTLSFDFLKYSLNHLDWTNIITGAAQPQITRQNLSPAIIPIPPLSIQRSIVAELDLLHSVISKKKEQLRELDNLAQSLFYQMFGDPITNPMGWEIKKLGEVCGIINGKNQKSVENPNGKYVICGSGGIMGRANDYICPENSIIIGRKGNINRPILMREKYWNVDTAFGLVPNTDSLLVDYLYIFTQEYDFEQLNVAVTIPSLRKTDIAEISLPLPPLSLQQSFAARVSAIEAQKQAITQSIQHTEALLAQRMDNYFS